MPFSYPGASIQVLHENKDMVIPKAGTDAATSKLQWLYFYLFFGLPPEEFGKLFVVHHRLCERILEVTIDDKTFISFPIGLPVRPNSFINSDGVEEAVPLVTFFNVVFVLGRDREQKESLLYGTSPKTANSLDGYRNMAKQLANCLRYEELRNCFVSNQVQAMFVVLDVFRRAVAHEQIKTFEKCMQQASSLAYNLTMMQRHFSTSSSHLTLTLNHWLPVNFLPDSTTPPCAMRPYHSLLLNYDQTDLLNKKLPADACGLLRHLLSLDRCVASVSAGFGFHVFDFWVCFKGQFPGAGAGAQSAPGALISDRLALGEMENCSGGM